MAFDVRTCKSFPRAYKQSSLLTQEKQQCSLLDKRRELFLAHTSVWHLYRGGFAPGLHGPDRQLQCPPPPPAGWNLVSCQTQAVSSDWHFAQHHVTEEMSTLVTHTHTHTHTHTAYNIDCWQASLPHPTLQMCTYIDRIVCCRFQTCWTSWRPCRLHSRVDRLQWKCF